MRLERKGAGERVIQPMSWKPISGNEYISILLLLLLLLCRRDRLQIAAVGPAEAGDGEDVGVMMVILCGGGEDYYLHPMGPKSNKP